MGGVWAAYMLLLAASVGLRAPMNTAPTYESSWTAARVFLGLNRSDHLSSETGLDTV